MNSQFLEFLGNYLIQAAKWQKLVNLPTVGNVSPVVDPTDYARLFKHFCSVASAPESDMPEYLQFWQQSLEQFQSLFSPYFKMWGWVSESDFRNLQEKCESLEKTIRKQEQIISQLRSLLDEKGLGQIEMIQRFQNLIQEQSDEFQNMMRNFGNALTQDGN
jgi:hypothetical protein